MTDQVKIEPTVGRIVYYKLKGKDESNNPGKIRPAIIVKVWENGLINLQVFTDQYNDDRAARYGIMWKTSVEQGDEEGQWDWMPYQKGQAKKTEELEKELKK